MAEFVFLQRCQGLNRGPQQRGHSCWRNVASLRSCGTSSVSPPRRVRLTTTSFNLCNYDVVRAGRGIVDEFLEAMGHELDWVAQEHKLAEQPQAPLPSILCLRSRSRASTQRQGVHHKRQGARTDAST